MSDDDSNDTNIPVIMTQWGPTTETARRQAVLNMRRDPAKLKQMIDKFGEAHIQRDFPEVFAKEDDASCALL